MFGSEIKDYANALNGELKAPGNWVAAYVDGSLAWPVKAQKITYLGTDFWIIPTTSDAYPGVAVRSPIGENKNTKGLILRFLSVLAWANGGGVNLISFGGGGRLYAFLRPKGGMLNVRESFDLRYFPEVTDPKQKLAIALMREARGLQHVAFSFLSFYRVLEVALGRRRVATWVGGAIERLENGRAKESLDKLRAGGITDVAGHLYVSGRCAIAHAGGNPIIDPDDPSDAARLYEERPLLEGLAELAIEEELGLKTARTVYREHLYELAGFKAKLGHDIVKAVQAGNSLEVVTVDVPAINFQIEGRGPFKALMNLQPSLCAQEGKVVHIEYMSPVTGICIKFDLNFETERLEFDIHNGIFGPPDDGSAEYAQCRAELTEFLKWYYANGCLVITDADTGELIARKDEFIPVNVMMDHNAIDAQIGDWRRVADSRREDQ